MKKKKVPNSTTETIKRPKTDSEWEEYLNVISFQMEPANDGFFKRLAVEVVTWARENNKALLISQFYLMKGIPEKTYFRWVEKHECLNTAHRVAMQYIGQRRELLLADKDPSSIRYIMPQYSDMWMKEDNRRAQQRKDIHKDQATDIKIEMIEFEAEDKA